LRDDSLRVAQVLKSKRPPPSSFVQQAKDGLDGLDARDVEAIRIELWILAHSLHQSLNASLRRYPHRDQRRRMSQQNG
jgi:hypothetical protein